MLFELVCALLNVEIWKGYEFSLFLLADLTLNTEIVVGLTSDSPGELHVLLHDGHSLGVDAAQVGILEDSDQVSLGGFLESEEGLSLASKGVIDLHADGSDDSLEGGSWKEEVGRLLVSLDLSEGDGTWLESNLSLLTILRLLG